MQISIIRQFMVFLLGAMLFTLFNAPYVYADSPADRDVKVAILALTPDASAGTTVALLEPLLPSDGVTLVDRNEIDQTLAERRLALSLSSDARAWRDLSAVIPADVFVLIAVHQNDDNKSMLLLRVIESRTGVVLGGMTLDFTALESSLEAMAKEVSLAVAQARVPEEQRLYLAFLGLRSDTPSSVIDQKARMLSAVLHARLAADPTVTLLEREQISLLTQEQTLSGNLLKLRTTGLILRGGLKPGGDDAHMIVTLNVQRLDGTATTDAVMVDMNDLSPAADAVAQLAAKMAQVNLKVTDTPDPAHEADRLAAMCRRVLGYARTESDLHWSHLRKEPANPALYIDALGFAEAAYVLDASDHHLTDLIYANNHLAGSVADLPPLITPVSRWEARLRTAELMLRRDRDRLLNNQLSNDILTKSAEIIFWAPSMPMPDRRDPQQIELWQQVVQVHRQRIAMLSDAFAAYDPKVRDQFHGTIATDGLMFSTSPDDFYDFVVRHYRLSEAAYAELLDLPPDPDDFSIAPAAIRYPYFGFSTTKRIHEYARYLTFLDQQENPLARIKAQQLRYKVDPSLAPTFYRDFFDAAYDPQSNLNRHLDRLEQKGRHVGHWGNDYSIYPLCREMGEAEFYRLWLDTLARLETTGQQQLLIRWHEWIDTVFRIARTVDPEGFPDLLDRIERNCKAVSDSPDHLRTYSRHRINVYLHDNRNMLAKEMLNSADPWNDYQYDWRPIDGTAFSRDANSQHSVNRSNMLNLPPGLEPYIFGIALQRHASNDPDQSAYLILLRESERVKVAGVESNAYQLVRLSVDLQRLVPICRFTDPIASPYFLSDHRLCVAVGDMMVLGTDDAGLVVIDTQGRHVYSEHEGAPSNDVTNLLLAEDRIYVAYPGVLAEFDLKSRSFRTIASARSAENRSPLDNTDQYQIKAMLQDPKHPQHIWLSVVPQGNSRDPINGIWRYDSTDDSLQRVAWNDTRSLNITSLAWREDHVMAARYYWYDHIVDIDAMTVVRFNYKSLPTSKRRFYRRCDDPNNRVIIDDHLFQAGQLYDARGESHRPPIRGLKLFYLWPSGDRFTAVTDDGFAIITRKPDTERDSSPGQRVTLWVCDDQAKNTPVLYIHGNIPRNVPPATFGQYLSRYEFTLQPEETVVLSGGDTKTGAMGYWMTDANGELLSYSHAGTPVLPAPVGTRLEYEAQPPHDQWESARPIPTWTDKLNSLRTVTDAPDIFPDDFVGVWLQSASGGNCTMIVYPNKP